MMRTLKLLAIAAWIVTAGGACDETVTSGDGTARTEAGQQDLVLDAARDAILDTADPGDAILVDGPVGVADAAYESIPCGGQDCNDHLDCTDDVCVASGCQNTIKPGACLIKGKCYKDQEINSATACQRCIAKATQQDWTDDVSLCPLSRLGCTTTTCSKGVCSSQTNSGYCLVGGVCLQHGATDPQNTCLYCNANISTTVLQTHADGAPCAADALICTADVCKAGACSHPLKSGACKISGACYLQGELHPTKDCQACNPLKSATAWSTAADGSICTADSLTCTADVCKAGACTHALMAGHCKIGGVCYLNGAANPANPCKKCVSNTSGSAWSDAPNNTACAPDAHSCTDDVCQAGKCAHPLKAGTCKINGTCYNAGQSHASKTCWNCKPGSSTTAWTTQVDGGPCAPDAFSCTSDVCSGGVCTHPIKSGQCKIGGACYGSGQFKTGNDCKLCNATASQVSWSTVLDGQPCQSDGHVCTKNVCLGGQCKHPLIKNWCFINSQCRPGGQPNPLTNCQWCLPKQTLYAWRTITYQGCCDGSVVRYCVSGVLQSLDCATNPHCGWSPTYSYYDCGTNGKAEPSLTYPLHCF